MALAATGSPGGRRLTMTTLSAWQVAPASSSAIAMSGTFEAQLIRGDDDDAGRCDQRTDDAEEPWSFDAVHDREQDREQRDDREDRHRRARAGVTDRLVEEEVGEGEPEHAEEHGAEQPVAAGRGSALDDHQRHQQGAGKDEPKPGRPERRHLAEDDLDGGRVRAGQDDEHPEREQDRTGRQDAPPGSPYTADRRQASHRAVSLRSLLRLTWLERNLAPPSPSS